MLNSVGNWRVLQEEAFFKVIGDFCNVFESQSEKYLYSRDMADKANGNIGI